MTIDEMREYKRKWAATKWASMSEAEKEVWRERSRKDYYKHKEKRKIQNTKWKMKNKEHIKKVYATWVIKNPDYRKKYNFLYRQTNRKRIQEQYNNRTKIDKEFHIRVRLSSLMNKYLKRYQTSKSAKTMDLVGCSAKELKLHLEKQFKPGMTWENYGYRGWHIDHIKPCVAFDLTDPEQQKICFHYTNLQPLWAKDNIQKGGKYVREAR